MAAAKTVQDLALDLEREKGINRAHEKVCAERVAAFNTALGALDDKVAGVGDKIDALGDKISDMATAHATAIGVARGLAEARKPKWWVGPAATIVGVLLAAVVGAFGWMASRIMSDNDLRIADAKQHPVATSTVTVNPPAAGVAETTPAPFVSPPP